MPSWSSVESWRAPRRSVDWNATHHWAGSFTAAVTAANQSLGACLEAWDLALEDIGGDPSRKDWASFRPLRLSREEDWSDWLAHLLESSRTGGFPARLLVRDVKAAKKWRVTKADREVGAAGYRADLVVRFQDSGWAHIEVKVGDLELEKTPATTTALQACVDGQFRGEYLLLPAADADYWNRVKKGLGGSGDGVTTLTWTDLARALRASMLERNEPVGWRVWAAAFLGAIEQRLLGFQPVGAGDIASGKYRPRVGDVERLGFLEAILKERS
jgi:hypothetical protein